MSNNTANKRKEVPPGAGGPSRPLKRTSSSEAQLDATSAMLRCEKCGREVPELNMAIHDATCHARNEQHGAPPRSSHAADRTNRDHRGAVENHGELENSGAPVASHSGDGVEAQYSPRPSSHFGVGTTIPHHGHVVAEAPVRPSGPTAPAATAPPPPEAATTNAPAATTDQAEWACPRCTLLNAPDALRCDACLLVRPGLRSHSNTMMSHTAAAAAAAAAAPPAHVRMQVRQVDAQALQTANTVLSGVIFGSLVGGGIGALVGAAGGAVVDGIARWNQRRSGTPRRTITVMTSTTTTAAGGSSGRRVVMVGGGGNGNHAQGAVSPADIDRIIMQMLLQSAMVQGAVNVNQMTYEELLERFGVGSERRGASQETIDALPLSKIEHVEELKENETTCNICLEDFHQGDDVRKLSCSHVFHKQCIDRWLLSVASCPICKREIQPAGHGAGADSRQEASAPSEEALHSHSE